MSLIKRNPNESLYPTGKKTILTIIKNEASPQTILWRVPYEDFNEGSKVIVAENEEALFYKNGVIEASFSGGEYSLNTDNYPFLSRIRNMTSGGISAYNCRIIYINKVHHLDNKWGTDGPIQVVDREFNIPLNLTARGSYSIQISNSKKFYMKFSGSTALALTSNDICENMRSPINQKIKSIISRVVSELNSEILGISSHLEEIAEYSRPLLEPIFDEYGVRMVNFYIEAIEIIEDESYRILKEARADAAARLVSASAAKKEISILGNDYGRVKTADIMTIAASNQGSNAVGDGLGLGAGIAMGGVMGASTMSVLTPLSTPTSQPPQEHDFKDDRFEPPSEFIIGPCGHSIPIHSKFCPECGKPTKKTCLNCGTEASPGDKFCKECGERFL